MTVRWSQDAAQDLDERVIYLVNEAGLRVAERFLDDVDRAVELLQDGRFDGPSITLVTGEEVMVWLIGDRRLYYRRVDEVLEVVRLYGSEQRPIERG